VHFDHAVVVYEQRPIDDCLADLLKKRVSPRASPEHSQNDDCVGHVLEAKSVSRTSGLKSR
jgi:hypothetical protein